MYMLHSCVGNIEKALLQCVSYKKGQMLSTVPEGSKTDTFFLSLVLFYCHVTHVFIQRYPLFSKSTVLCCHQNSLLWEGLLKIPGFVILSNIVALFLPKDPIWMSLHNTDPCSNSCSSITEIQQKQKTTWVVYSCENRKSVRSSLQH